MTRHYSTLQRDTLREPIEISTSQRLSIQMAQNPPFDAEVSLIDTTGYLNDTQFSSESNGNQSNVNQTHHDADSTPLCQYRVKQESGNRVRIVRIMSDDPRNEIVVKELTGRVAELNRNAYDKILVEDLLGNVLPSEEESMIEQESMNQSK
mmetsp:Transcript_7844/g.29351  ORF Transcript_7844/g.29351 Transcript_7844/m.29351 type:complete len:151 (-) Transcript_7844:7291-7743(-)